MPGNTVCLDVEMSAENCPASIEMSAENFPASKKKKCSSGLEHAIKVRKPYTITKPRERWTKEEHNKFLEALKLYGRAWRQIEEHVGTKTAVQIRSHAQKFFTKVVRETTGDDSGQVKNIEIPPPRPKKKPLHPYPRKLGNSLSIPMAKKQEWSSTPYISSSEQGNLSMPELSLHAQDNMSPTTVLSVVGSDTIGLTASDPMSRCTSPASSVFGSDPAQSTTSVDNEENSLFQLKSDMGLDSGADECIPWKEASSSMEAPASTLKLFGKTVVVADPQKQNVATGARAVQSDEGQTKWNSWPIGVTPMFCLFPSHGGLPNSFEGGVVPMPCLWASNLTAATPNFCLEQDRLPICGVFSNGGGADFKAAPSPEARIGSGSSNAVSDGVQNSSLKFKPSETSAFRILKAPLSKAAAGKGFVPYRRCVAERKENNHNRVDGCSEGQQLCLSVGD